MSLLRRRMTVTLACGLILIGLGWPGCGVVGPPIPPEDVGLAARLEKEKKKAAEAQRPPEGGPPAAAEEVELPPLRPIGTR